MTEEERQIFAHLNMIEFILEISMANQFAALPQEQCDRWVQDFLHKMRQIIIPADAARYDEDQIMAMALDAKDLAERLLNRVIVRADQLRSAAGAG